MKISAISAASGRQKKVGSYQAIKDAGNDQAFGRGYQDHELSLEGTAGQGLSHRFRRFPPLWAAGTPRRSKVLRLAHGPEELYRAP